MLATFFLMQRVGGGQSSGAGSVLKLQGKNQGVYRGGQGGSAPTYTCKGGAPPLELRAITLFKSELKSEEY